MNANTNNLVGAFITLVIVGLALYLVENYVPMSPPIKTVLRVIVVIFLILFLLSLFGIFSFR